MSSEGRRSGVHWTRRKTPPMVRASALARRVLPTPGTSSTRRWPPERRATRARVTGSGLPRRTPSTRCRTAAASSPAASTAGSGGTAATVCEVGVAITSLRPAPRPNPRAFGVSSPASGHRKSRRNGLRDEDLVEHRLVAGAGVAGPQRVEVGDDLAEVVARVLQGRALDRRRGEAEEGEELVEGRGRARRGGPRSRGGGAAGRAAPTYSAIVAFSSSTASSRSSKSATSTSNASRRASPS